jgi:hypothetical protein
MQIERSPDACRAFGGRLLAVLIAMSIVCIAACAHQQPPDNGRTASPPSSSSSAKNSCREDKDCPSGFCDRAVCQTPSQTVANAYGRACVAAPRTAEGFRDATREICGPYLCLDGRCRSCQSDKECQSELGSPRCYQLPGESGARCGNPQTIDDAANSRER